jgi:hypothetical protein
VIITCPNCDFSKDVPSEKLPARSVIATCPGCSCRFRFSPTGGEGVLEMPPPEETPRDDSSPDRDDPLPPGAVVPGCGASDPEKGFPAGGGLAARRGDAHDDTHAERQNAEHGMEHRAEPDEADEREARLAAGRAYGREAARFDGAAGGGSSPDDNPWVWAPGEDGWLAAFRRTVLRVMFAAPQFFAALVPQPSPLRALGFYLLVGVAQIVVERFWGYLFLQYINADGPPQDQQLAALLTMLAPQANLAMTVLLRTGVLVLELYFFAALTHLAYRFLAPDRAEFSLVFQVIAYSAAPALLCVIPLIGSLTGFVWGLSCIIVGCRAALRLTWAQTLTGFAPACAVALLFLSQFMKAV